MSSGACCDFIRSVVFFSRRCKQTEVLAGLVLGLAVLSFSSLSSVWGQTIASDSALTPFRIQQKKFARFLRAKYAALDSLRRKNALAISPHLQFFSQPNQLFGLDVRQFGNPEFWGQPGSRDAALRAKGGQETVFLGPAQIMAAFKTASPWQGNRSRYNPHRIPSNLQLSILSGLWKTEQATQQEIYSALGKEYPITAEGLDRQLARMVEMGLVERKIISPQHLFTILTPLKSFQLEMSAQNRRNRIYLYRPLVAREEILKVLLSRMDQVKNAAGSDQSELERLTQKLRIVLSNQG